MLSQDFSQSTGNPAYLAHLSDIWIILTRICVFIFCSMWLEKTFRYHWGSSSPKLNHSPPEDVVKYCGLIIFADLILSSCRQWNLLQRTLASWNNLQIFFAALYIHSFTKQHWSENSQFEALKLSKNKWENLGENKRDTIVNRDINRDVWFSDLELFQI